MVSWEFRVMLNVLLNGSNIMWNIAIFIHTSKKIFTFYLLNRHDSQLGYVRSTLVERILIKLIKYNLPIHESLLGESLKPVRHTQLKLPIRFMHSPLAHTPGISRHSSMSEIN